MGELFLLVEDLHQLQTVSEELAEVVQGQQDEGDPLEVKVVRDADKGESQDRVDDLVLLVLLLDLLEVQLGQHMNVVGQLDDKVEFVEEAHRVVGVVFP